MSTYTFIKDAGAKIFGVGRSSAEKNLEVTEQKKTEVQRENELAENKLREVINELGLKVEGLRINIEGDKATVSGKAKSQATREKIILAVGNSEGIAKVEEKLEVKGEEEEEASFHTVEQGENLRVIAEKRYGDTNKYPIIFEANKPLLKDPDKVFLGQVLRIPHLEKPEK